MLKDLQINKNEVVVAFPRFKSFKLNMRYIPRDELAAIREKTVTISFNRVTRTREEQVDTDKFMDTYIQKAITGWSGLTYEIITALVPVQVDASKLQEEIPYSHEDALWLVKNSTEFDTFISDTMNDVNLFSATTKEEDLKK
jgi:hypothetical protein